jgi:hypothetical protein
LLVFSPAATRAASQRSESIRSFQIQPRCSILRLPAKVPIFEVAIFEVDRRIGKALHFISPVGYSLGTEA